MTAPAYEQRKNIVLIVTDQERGKTIFSLFIQIVSTHQTSIPTFADSVTFKHCPITSHLWTTSTM